MRDAAPGPARGTGAPRLAAAAVMLRDDDAVLLVRHPADGGADAFAGRWSLPLSVVAGTESAEDTAIRVMRGQLHVEPGPLEFNDTLYLVGADGSRFVVNAFLSVGWQGDPRFSPQDYADAAWVAPGSVSSLRRQLDGELVDGIDEWLARAFDRGAAEQTPQGMLAELDAARDELVAAFEMIPARMRAEPLDGTWSPADVLSHVADAEAYCVNELRLVLGTAGHTWQPFNTAQWDVAHDLRWHRGARETEQPARARLDAARDDTRLWIHPLDPEDLRAYGNHLERGVVQVGERIDHIARHDREHTEQLRAMAQAARLQAASDERA